MNTKGIAVLYLLRYLWLIDNTIVRGLLGVIGGVYCGMQVKKVPVAHAMFLLEKS